MKAMKRIAFTLLCVLMSLLACFCFVACDDKGDGGKGDGGPGDGGTTPTPPPPAPVIAVGDVSGSFTYDGTEHKPTVSVTIDGVAMVAGTDYNLVYANNKNAGTASVTVDFIGEYADETDVTKNFTIGAKEVTPAVTLDEDEFTYDGTAKTPAVVVKDGGTPLVKDTDYTVAYASNLNAGTATVTVTLKGNYTGSKTTNFTINKATVAEPDVTNVQKTFTYNGQAQTYAIPPSNLYTVSGATQTAAGTYTVTVALVDDDNYEWAEGGVEALTFDDFVINKATVAKPVADETQFVYNGQAQTYAITPNALYTVSGATQTAAGTYTVTVALIDTESIEWAEVGGTENVTFNFVINKATAVKPVADDTQFIYNGQAQTYYVAENALYTVTGATQTNADIYTVTVALVDDVNTEWAEGGVDDIEFNFKIEAYDASVATFAVADAILGSEPEVTLELDGFTLTPDVDYTLTLGDFATAGDKTATIEFIGNFDGTLIDAYRIKSITEVSEVYIDFNNGRIVDTAGTPNAVTTVGTPDLTTTPGAVQGLNKDNGVLVNADMGTEDFTISFDIKLPRTSYDGTSNANYGEIMSSGAENPDGIYGGYAEAHHAFQFSWRQTNGTNTTGYGFRVALGANCNDFYWWNEDKLIFDDWMTVTYVVDRNTGIDTSDNANKNVTNNNIIGSFRAEEIATVTLYINGVSLGSKNYNLVTGQTLGTGVIKMGNGRENPNGPFELDNFYFIKSALPAESVAKIAQNTAAEGSENNEWRITSPDVVFDFNADAEENYTANITIEKLEAESLYGEAVFAADGIANFASYIGEGVENGNVITYTITIPKADYELFEGGVNASITVNGVRKNFKVIYTPLAVMYLDKSAVEMWADEKQDGNYIVNIKLTADETGNVVIGDTLNAVFTLDEELTYTYANGIYSVVIPAALVERQGLKTITVTLGAIEGIEPVTFTLEHKYLDDAAIADLVANTELYMNFNGNINEFVGNRATSMEEGTLAYADGVDGQAIQLNPNNTRLKIADYNFGTTSFTMSFDLKINDDADKMYGYAAPDYELVASKADNTDDDNDSTFEFSYRGNNNEKRLRFQVGPNYDVPYVGAADTIKFGTWQRVTVVVTRGLENNESATPTTPGGYADRAVYTEKVTYQFYIDGKPVTASAIRSYRKPQKFGFENLYLGGDNSGSYGNNNFWMDNLVIYRGEMTADQVRGLSSVNSSYYADLVSTFGVQVADANVTFADKDDVLANGYDLTLVNKGKTDLTGATLEGAPVGITLEENGASYKLKFYEEADLTACETPVTLTLNWGDVARSFTLTYAPLQALYTDTSAVELWNNDAVGGEYTISAGIFVNPEKTISLTDAMLEAEGLDFALDGIDGAEAEYDSASGKWIITIPQTAINEQTLNLEFGISENDEVTPAIIAVTHKVLNAEEQRALRANLTHYYNFDGNVVNMVDEKEARFIFGNDQAAIANPNAYADENTAYVSDVEERYMIADGVSIGTGSFTVSMLVNIDDLRVNSKHNGNSGRATGIFGTSDIDNAFGFNVATTTNYPINNQNTGNLRIRVMGTNMTISGTLDYSGNGYQRLTFVFDRTTTAGTLIVTVYQGGRVVATGSRTLDAKQTLDYTYPTGGDGTNSKNTADTNGGFGIGNGGVYDGVANNLRGTGEIRYSDFMIFNKALTSDEARGLYNDGIDAMVNDLCVDVADVALTFGEKADVLANGYNLTFVEYGRTDLTGATLESPVGDIDLVANGSSYKLNFTETALNACKTAQTLTIKWGTVAKTFTVTYADLEALYTDLTTVSKWTDEKTGDNYVFEAGIYINPEKTIALTDAMGKTPVISGVDATLAFNAGKWTITIPEAQVENQAAKAISIGIDGESVTPAEFTFEHKYLDEATMTKLVNGTEAYLNFNDNIYNHVAGEVSTSMALGTTPTYVDGIDGKAIQLNPANKVLKISNYNLGTTSFTMSFDLNIDAGGSIASWGNDYELVGSKDYSRTYPGGDYDGHASTFSFAYRGNHNRLRFQAGRNDGTAQYLAGDIWGAGNTAMQLGTWQRITVVVERGIVPTGDLTVMKDAGNYDNYANYSQNAHGTYAISELMNYHFYLDGKLWKSYTNIQSSNQELGLGDLYLGGDYGVKVARDRNHNFKMDNFVIYRGVMTADEVRGMTSVNSSYYATLAGRNGFDVADVAFDYNEVTSAEGHTVDLTLLDYGVATKTGATLAQEDEDNGFELIENEGTYSLKMDADALALAKDGYTLTFNLGGIERTFKVTYVALEALHTEDIKLVEIEKKTDDAENFPNGYVVRTVKVTADESGNVGVENVVFDGLEFVEEKGNGEYEIKIPFAVATYTISHPALTGTFDLKVVKLVETIVNDISPLTTYSTKSTYGDSPVQGGKVFNLSENGKEFGTNSFTLSMEISGLENYPNASGSSMLFTTSHTDAYQGFTLYYNNDNGFRFRTGNGDKDLDGTSKGSDARIKANPSGYGILTVTFDRSVRGKVTYTVYWNGQNLGSSTFTIEPNSNIKDGSVTNPSFDTTGHVVVGSANTAYTGKSSNTDNAGCPNDEFFLGIGNVLILKDVVDAETCENYIKANVVKDEETIEKLANGTELYMNFDNNITEFVSGKTTSMARGSASYVDAPNGSKAIALNPAKTAVKIANYNLGKKSFTMSFDLKVENGANLASLDAKNELVASKGEGETNTSDAGSSVFQLSYREKDYHSLRIQTGNNTVSSYAYNGSERVVGRWFKVTVVVDRVIVVNDQEEATETVTFKFYLNGKLLKTETKANAFGQTLGYTNLWLGGDTAQADNNFWMDNFLVYDGAMTDAEVATMYAASADLYDAIMAKHAQA